MSTWLFEVGDESNEWVTLPGPAEWWPENYDYAQHGFDTPLTNDGYQSAFFMMHASEEPLEFGLVNPAENELQVLPDTIKTQRILESFSLV